jgi:hypothetical protein
MSPPAHFSRKDTNTTTNKNHSCCCLACTVLPSPPTSSGSLQSGQSVRLGRPTGHRRCADGRTGQCKCMQPPAFRRRSFESDGGRPRRGCRVAYAVSSPKVDFGDLPIYHLGDMWELSWLVPRDKSASFSAGRERRRLLLDLPNPFHAVLMYNPLRYLPPKVGS